MKLTGIVCIGSYYSPWFSFGLASFYFVDELVVINGGYNLKNPHKDEYNIPLKQISKDIDELDIDGKVVEWTGWTLRDLKHKLVLGTEKEHPPTPFWADLRGIELTLATEKAIERGADWILKFDSDQVGYSNCIAFKKDLRSVIFKQFEFAEDIYHLSVPQPDSCFNDSVYSYKPQKDDFFGGGGAPAIHSDRQPCESYWCAHLRSANPLELSEEEKYEHFYGRNWFRVFTNQGLWGQELRDIADSSAKSSLHPNTVKSTVDPPEACLMRPIDYIREVIKKDAWYST